MGRFRLNGERIKHLRKRAHWFLLHIAFLFFFADVIGYVYPPFGKMWEGVSHVCVALAALLATGAEYLVEEGGE